MEKDDVIEILKRNVSLFKEEKDFVEYIVDLAMYLIEFHLDENTPLSKEMNLDERLKEETQARYRIFKKFGDTHPRPKNCRFCGAPTEGKTRCPNCNNMTI